MGDDEDNRRVFSLLSSYRSRGANWPIGVCFVLLALISACGLQHYEAAPLDVARTTIPASLNDARIRATLEAGGIAGAEWPPVEWDLSMLVGAALAVHPALAAQRSRIELARAVIVSAGARPNPVLGLPLEHHSRREDDDDNRFGGGIGLSWVLQARGSRRAAIAAAEAERRAAEFDLRDRAWQIRRAVRAAWAEAVFAKHRLELLKRAGSHAHARTELIASRVAVGESGAFELAQSQLAGQRFRLRAIVQDADFVTARAKLSSAMGLQSSSLEGVRFDVSVGELMNDVALPEPDRMQFDALTTRADILAALARYAASEARLEREIALQMPEIRLSPSWFYEQGDNIWALATGLPIPVMNRNEGPIAVARAQRSVAAARFRELQTDVVTRLQLARNRIDATAGALTLALGLLDAAAESEAASRRQADAGYADHLLVSQLEQQVLNAELEVLELRASLYNALGQLEDAVYKPLDGGVFGDVVDVHIE